MTKFTLKELGDIITYDPVHNHWSFVNAGAEDETLLDMFATESRRHIGHHIPPESVVEKTAAALGFTVTFLETSPPPNPDDIPPGAIS